MDALTRLTEYGENLVASLQADIASKPVTRYGPVNASGRLAASLRFDVAETPTGYRLTLYGATYALTLEYGRRPGKFPNLLAIQQWIEDKGIVPRPDAKGRPVSTKSLAYLIGRAIAQKGTLLYQAGQPSGLFGDHIGPAIVAQELAKLLLPVLHEQVVSALRAA